MANIKKQIIENYTKEKPWSFSGINKIYDHFDGKITRNDINDALAEINVYTKFKKTKKQKKFSPIYVFNK